jgi:hypothetical protein
LFGEHDKVFARGESQRREATAIADGKFAAPSETGVVEVIVDERKDDLTSPIGLNRYFALGSLSHVGSD